MINWLEGINEDLRDERMAEMMNKHNRYIRIVNIRDTKDYDVYIGRKKDSVFHYGNPFTHKIGTLAGIIVGSVHEAVEAYELWLEGKKYTEVEPERRKWILNNLSRLKGKRLGCFCVKPNLNVPCHGFVLKKLVEKYCK